MKILKRILTICVIIGLAYLAVYAVQDLRARSADGRRSGEAQILRAENTPFATPDTTNIPVETSTEAPEAAQMPAAEFTEAPEMTQMPAETSASTPDATAEPVETVTEAPAVTDLPTEAPVVTQEPAVTQTPAIQLGEMAAPTDAPTQEPATAPAPDPLLLYYDELHAQNTDMVGWIYVEGTVIDYPVMYTPEDEEFYLHKNFEKKYSFAGTPFIDARCELDPRCDNVIIYAHNMKNGTMFGQLSKYLESDFFEDYPFVSYDTLHERGDYLIFAVIPVYMGRMDDERMRCYGTSMTQDENQVQMLYDYLDTYAVHVRSEALPGVGDKIVTLSTCTGYRDADRLVIMAVKMD